MLHKIVDQNGNVYKGEVLRGRRHGRGTIVYADTRDVYQGDFENDVPHGAGRYFRAGAENGGSLQLRRRCNGRGRLPSPCRLRAGGGP